MILTVLTVWCGSCGPHPLSCGSENQNLPLCDFFICTFFVSSHVVRENEQDPSGPCMDRSGSGLGHFCPQFMVRMQMYDSDLNIRLGRVIFLCIWKKKKKQWWTYSQIAQLIINETIVLIFCTAQISLPLTINHRWLNYTHFMRQHPH